MFGRGATLYWAIVGVLLGVGAVMSYPIHVMLAMGFAGVCAACLLVAGSCLLAPPKRRDRFDEDDDAPRPRKRNWRP